MNLETYKRISKEKLHLKLWGTTIGFAIGIILGVTICSVAHADASEYPKYVGGHYFQTEKELLTTNFPEQYQPEYWHVQEVMQDLYGAECEAQGLWFAYTESPIPFIYAPHKYRCMQDERYAVAATGRWYKHILWGTYGNFDNYVEKELGHIWKPTN